jgi:hypothetical protein
VVAVLAVSATVSRTVNTPLAAALLRIGLSEQQIARDNWTALMSLPQAAVDAIVSAVALSDAGKTAVEKAATLDVLLVKPSSAVSCELWCRVLASFAEGRAGQKLLGTAEVRDALVAVQPQATTADAQQRRTTTTPTPNSSPRRLCAMRW